MEKGELKENLQEKFGIETTNCNEKKTYLRNNVPTIGLFEWEFKEDFYFYIDYTGKYYRLPKMDKSQFPTERFGEKNTLKYQVPLSKAIEIKEQKLSSQEEFKEQEDSHFMGEVTLRDLYAVIHNKPVSNKQWLNSLILGKN